MGARDPEALSLPLGTDENTRGQFLNISHSYERYSSIPSPKTLAKDPNRHHHGFHQGSLAGNFGYGHSERRQVDYHKSPYPDRHAIHIHE